jgi:AcrR family transcriptional regulator
MHAMDSTYRVPPMAPDQITPLTAKGERTRERILEAALALFVEKGYEATTLREIAAAADCSLGLAYRYFASKESLVLTFYERTARELEADVRRLSPAPLAERFSTVMHAKMERLTPYRDAFGSLFAAALNPQSGVAVLGESRTGVRRSVAAIFTAVVQGAIDAPPEPQAGELAIVLYSMHLTLLLFWLHDHTPGYRSTEQLLTFTCLALELGSPLLTMEPFAQALSQLTAALTPVFGGLDGGPAVARPAHADDAAPRA